MSWITRLFENPLHPYTQGLLGSIPRVDGTRARVQAVIDREKYQPDPQARGLAFRRSFLIGVVYTFRTLNAGSELVVINAAGTPQSAVLKPVLLVGLIGAICNPSVVREERNYIDDVAVVVVDDSASQHIGNRAEVKRGFSIVPVHCHTVNCGHEIPTDVMRFGTDIPCLTNWGTPLLYGPGSIHDAHTSHEYIAKEDLKNAIMCLKEALKVYPGKTN